MSLKLISLGVMSVFYVFAGVMHFLKPRMYLKIMPPFLPKPLALVYISGVVEAVLGGLLWVPTLRFWAAWGIVALLIAVFPANIYMYQKRTTTFRSMSPWLLALRLPLQLVLMAWAYSLT